MGGSKPNPNTNAFNQQQRDYQNAAQSGLIGSQGRSDEAYNTQFGGYQNLLTGLQNPQTSGGGGGADAARNAAIAAIQGAGGGGNSTNLYANIRARGESFLPAFYDRMRSEQERLQNVQGGYNPGFTSQMSKLAREQSQGAAKSKLETDIQIGKMQQAAAQANAQLQLQKAGMLAGLSRGGGGGGGSDDNFRQQMSVLSAMGDMRGQSPGEVGMYLQGGLGGLNALGQYGGLGGAPGSGFTTEKKIGMGASVAVPIAVALI